MLPDMTDDSAVSAFRDAFITRTKQSREARGLTQREMAIALGIEKEAYSKYESRSCLPHHLVRRFCMVCNISVDSLFDVEVRARPLAQRASRTARS